MHVWLPVYVHHAVDYTLTTMGAGVQLRTFTRFYAAVFLGSKRWIRDFK